MFTQTQQTTTNTQAFADIFNQKTMQIRMIFRSYSKRERARDNQVHLFLERAIFNGARRTQYKDLECKWKRGEGGGRRGGRGRKRRGGNWALCNDDDPMRLKAGAFFDESITHRLNSTPGQDELWELRKQSVVSDWSGMWGQVDREDRITMKQEEDELRHLIKGDFLFTNPIHRCLAT